MTTDKDTSVVTDKNTPTGTDKDAADRGAPPRVSAPRGDYAFAHTATPAPAPLPTQSFAAGEAKEARRELRQIIDEPAVVSRISQTGSMRRFTTSSTFAAAVMVLAAILAVIVANLPAYEVVQEVLEAPIVVGVGPVTVALSIESFINDFLMAVFFMLVGVELKYEMKVGQLRHPRQAALPMLAAVGGVAVPALIYLAINRGGATSGWAVPIATDIAFALGVMSLLGDRVAPETKVFFQTLAIADDILAIVVLALFYGQTPSIPWCAAALGAVVVLWAINRANVYSVRPYVAVGLVLWVCMYKSGIHATLAGVILAFFLPVQSDIKLDSLRDWLVSRADDLDIRYDAHDHVLGQHEFTETANYVERIMHHVTPPLHRLENYVSTTVNFVILPLFAFANAQVRLVGVDLAGVVGSPVAQGAFLGAVLGKPIGIILVTFMLVRVGFARLPDHVTWPQVVAVGLMGGVGFTMSILIAGLAYDTSSQILEAKCAILAAAVTSSVLGLAYVNAGEAIAGVRGGDRDARGAGTRTS